VHDIMVHKYGPHIFHTDNERIWKWFSQFAVMMPHIQRTKGLRDGSVYSLPINLHTINQFFGTIMAPREARMFIRERCAHISNPKNFEEQALATIGPDLYHAFMCDYTKKQWGLDPVELPASILKRLPMRFDYNDNAFFHKFQGIPRDGYTDAVWKMLDLPTINVHLGQKVNRRTLRGYDHIFWSGPIDEFFEGSRGWLPYRTLDLEVLHAAEDAQGCSVMNNCDGITPWTRSTEHKHFTPWETHADTVVTREYPRQWEPGDIHYYPIRFAKDKDQLAEYQALAHDESSYLTFVGRLGTYEYLDMDVTIGRSLDVARSFLRRRNIA
jgi:UDP-galactopyranose mutase